MNLQNKLTKLDSARSLLGEISDDLILENNQEFEQELMRTILNDLDELEFRWRD